MERPGPPQHLGPILEASLVLFRFGGEGTWASPWTMDAPCVRGLMPNSWSLSHPQSLGSFLWLPQQDSFEDGAVKGVAGAHNFQAAVSHHGFSCAPFTHQSSAPSPHPQALVPAGEVTLPQGWVRGGGSLQAYLLTLLDVVVLPGVGTPHEHDFELLLVPAMDEGGEVLNWLVGEDRRVAGACGGSGGGPHL